MPVLATIVFLPTFNVLELSGVAACHLVLTVLIGLAFRNHLNDLRSAWEFTVCAAVWWTWAVGAVVLLGQAWSLPGYVFDTWYGLQYSTSRLAGLTGPLLTGLLYAWVFQQRHSIHGLSRLVWTLAATCAVWGLWLGLRNLPVDWITVTIDADDGWLYGVAMQADADTLPSWQSAVGWIIWYVGLFGGKMKTKGTTGAEPLGVTSQGTSA
jgi:hypothetical protein